MSALTDEKFTRCTGCGTVFRVTPQQLSLRSGQVRCGHCRTVFDGYAQLISLAPQPRPKADADFDELAAGPPTMTLRSARSLDPAPIDAGAPRESSAAGAAREPSAAGAASLADAAGAAIGRGKAPTREPTLGKEAPVRDDFDAGSDAADPDARPRWRRFAAVAAPLALGALLVGQVTLHYRDSIAARWPGAKPALARLCAPFGCEVRPLRDAAGLSIDASDLQADAAHRGLLILTATIRNRATVNLAFPTLELTLTDNADQVVVRRALPPADYASGTVDVANGIPPNGEVLVKLFIDASATQQAGYRLYLFYP